MDFNISSSSTGQFLTSQVLQPFPVGLVTASAILIPICYTIFHRVYFHPLRHVPGPWLAAASDLYGFYHNFIREGGYSKKFRYLHDKYNSPVVRIGPNHVHVNDPQFFEEVFYIGSKYSKDPSFYKYFGGLDSMINPSYFRIYRSHIASLYSTRSVDSLAPRLLSELQSIAKRLSPEVGTDKTINIQQMLRTLSADMVLRILFPQDINLINYDGYHPFLEAFDVIMTKTWLMVTYPVVGMALSLIPGSGYMNFKLAFERFTLYCRNWADEAQNLRDNVNEWPERDSHMTRYLNIDPNDQKKVEAVPHPLEDIFNFIAGGSDTTAYSTACAVYYLLSSPDALAKLQAELYDAAPFIREQFDHKKIQSLVYLNAVVKETLRLASPVPGCLPRTVPDGGARVGSINIPAGAAVSVSLLAIQQNEDLFPEPQMFIPERWLGEQGKINEKWNVAFSRGPRQCIGTNIAYMELHSSLAYLFSHFEFELAMNPGKKLEWVDRFVATNLEDVQVKVVKDLWL
ncbi:putative elymoclavine monooxygenase [Daldinia decipiens]|uniref:putative elymoclavine monooxygenase n=1 Tax=Daldinia decipiens TaxID=326647 RepID=UPI0020C1FA80|nr:putative elymoclavine monooxygenase [Daldinia decipiens]KAI1658832.1 putative elymoclavine monooxygenase [Daldinia decipiens]